MISIAYHQPLVQGGAYLGTLGNELESYQHTLTTLEGYESASFAIRANQGELEEWLENGIGRHITTYNRAGQIVWEGFVNTITLTQGRLRIERGPLLDIGNYLWCVYSPPDVSFNPPRSGAKTETTAAQDATSQAKYGTVEKLLSAGTVEDDIAEQIRDTYLAEHANPTMTPAIGEPDAPGIQVDCLGYFAWLDAVIFENTDPYFLVPISGEDYGDINDNLVAWWKMEEATGAQRNDSIGVAHLTDHNNVVRVAGHVNNCASFTSASSMYLDSAAAALDCGDIDFTLCCWFWGDSVTAIPKSILSKITLGAGTWDGYNLGWNGGHIRWAVGNGTSLKIVDGGVVTAGAWHFIVVKHNAVADIIEIQIDNGAPLVLSTGGTFPNDTASNFCVGSLGAARYHDGDVDEVGFWKRILSYDETDYLYNAGAGRTTPITCATTPYGMLQQVLNAARAVNSWCIDSDLSSLDENLLLTGSVESDNMTCGSMVKSLLSVGDATDARWLFGIYADQKAKYWQAPTAYEYYANVLDNNLDVKSAYGQSIDACDVKPGKWLLMTDFLPGRGSAQGLSTADPRSMFIERVTFTIPNTLALEGGKIGTLKQMVERLGLGGISS